MANPSLEDALHAAQTLRAQKATVGSKIVLDFLEPLAKMAEPQSGLASETESYVLDGAMQSGFEPIDDNADLYVVHANDLVKFILDQRAGAARLALQKAARQALLPVVLSMQDEVELGRLVTEFANTPLFGEGRLRKDVFSDLRNWVGVGQAANRQDRAASALRAIQARINGVWDDPDLVAYGALSTDPLEDIKTLADEALT